MSNYNFDKSVDVGKFTVEIDSKAAYGYFEHHELGDDCGGGLWFTKNELTDYDGVFELPASVTCGIRELGFIVPEEME